MSYLAYEWAIAGELEFHSDGVVGGVVGPFGVGGELDFHASGNGLVEQGVAAGAELAGGALAAGLAGLRGLVGSQGVGEFLAFGGSDFAEFVGGGLEVNGGGVLFEDGAAFRKVDADAVIEEDGGIGGVVFDAGVCLNEPIHHKC